MESRLALWPKDLAQKLEFDKIQELLTNYCLGDLGRAHCADMPLYTEAHKIEALLQEGFEYYQLQQVYQFPMRAYSDLSEDMRMLSIEGYVLSLESLRLLRANLSLTQDILRFFEQKKEARQLYPSLFRFLDSIEYEPSLLPLINQILDEEGQVRPNASPELSRLARLKQSKAHELDKRFRQVLMQYQQRNMLADTGESFRNGRRVLAVPAEFKRQVRGIMHDESATGRTVFIEPEEVIDLNNDLFDIEQEERREIFRILRDLSAKLHPYTAHFLGHQRLLTRFDVLQAKTRLTVRLNASKPKLFSKPHYKLEEAFHPLLKLKNAAEGRKTMPFDLHFREPARILILSGPNAGGKSICMKTVGLLQIMLQAGLLLPLGEGSEMGIVEQIFGDIGDQQSIDDELSTYSSRLHNAKYFVEQANERSLVLIDEFGSGTDPKMGGAIAEGILRELNFAGVYGVVTTHYSNLKRFAHEQKGLINGSMVFDQETLSPTYRLQVGRPGSSYAFEIATKTGLQNRIIRYARQRIGVQEENFEDMLIELQRERQKLQEAQELVQMQQKNLDQLIKNYEYAQRDLEFGRKKLKLQVKEQELQDSRQAQQDLQKLMKELREAENAQKAAEQARALLRQQQREREQLSQKVEHIKEELYEIYTTQDSPTKIEVGCQVRLRDGQSTGLVREIKRKEAIVEVGNMQLTIPLRDLVRLENPLEIKKEVSGVRTDIVKKTFAFEPKLDIRGMRYEDALSTVENFLDEALLANVKEVSIIHGRGTGTLKKAAWFKLREYRSVRRIYHPEQHQGGEGATFVEFGGD